MDVTSIRCDGCNASVAVAQGTTRATCEFCGTVKIVSLEGAENTSVSEYRKLFNLAEHMKEKYVKGVEIRHIGTGKYGFDAVLEYYANAEVADGRDCAEYFLALTRAYPEIVIAALQHGRVILLSINACVCNYEDFMNYAMQHTKGDLVELENERERTVAKFRVDLAQFPEKKPKSKSAIKEAKKKGR